ncbi:MAG: c-type cytochrome [Saprospiraceae bacterium]|nr:c-type cytochrome [Saprospiraceae bacterium]
MSIPNTTILIILTFSLYLPSKFETNSISYQNESILKGEKIYMEGIGSTELKIEAVSMGRSIPASIVTCASCHGQCGKGGEAQGMIVPDIRRASYLMRYSMGTNKILSEKEMNKKIKRLITLGINHDGKKVKSMMPKYTMSLKDMDYLLAYLEVLGNDEKCANE